MASQLGPYTVVDVSMAQNGVVWQVQDKNGEPIKFISNGHLSTKTSYSHAQANAEAAALNADDSEYVAFLSGILFESAGNSASVYAILSALVATSNALLTAAVAAGAAVPAGFNSALAAAVALLEVAAL